MLIEDSIFKVIYNLIKPYCYLDFKNSNHKLLKYMLLQVNNKIFENHYSAILIYGIKQCVYSAYIYIYIIAFIIHYIIAFFFHFMLLKQLVRYS